MTNTIPRENQLNFLYIYNRKIIASDNNCKFTIDIDFKTKKILIELQKIFNNEKQILSLDFGKFSTMRKKIDDYIFTKEKHFQNTLFFYLKGDCFFSFSLFREKGGVEFCLYSYKEEDKFIKKEDFNKNQVIFEYERKK